MSRRNNKVPRGAAGKKESTNYNTANLKICFFELPEDGKAVPILDKESMENLLKAADFGLKRAVKKESNIGGFAVVNPGCKFGQKEFAVLTSHLKSKNATILSAIGDVITLESEEGYIISIQIVWRSKIC